jgi:hypothetical protein
VDMGMLSNSAIFRQLMPLARRSRAWSRRKTRRSRPRDFPLSLAVRMPETTRSLIISLSNSATAAKMCRMNCEVGLLSSVSMFDQGCADHARTSASGQPNITFVKGDVLTQSLEPSSFDFVVADTSPPFLLTLGSASIPEFQKVTDGYAVTQDLVTF